MKVGQSPTLSILSREHQIQHQLKINFLFDADVLDDDLTQTSPSPQGLQQIRCPPGLAFDLEKQTCDWKWAVTNCDKITKEKKAAPLLNTEEPLCDPNKLACGDAICINKELFCDGKPDCNDGSDENACGEYFISNCSNSVWTSELCSFQRVYFVSRLDLDPTKADYFQLLLFDV